MWFSMSLPLSYFPANAPSLKFYTLPHYTYTTQKRQPLIVCLGRLHDVQSPVAYHAGNAVAKFVGFATLIPVAQTQVSSASNVQLRTTGSQYNGKKKPLWLNTRTHTNFGGERKKRKEKERGKRTYVENFFRLVKRR